MNIVSVAFRVILCASPLFAVACDGRDGASAGPTADEIRAASASSTVELRFSAESKALAIQYGTFAETLFTGNKIVVDSTKTEIDIDVVRPDDVPDSVCYTGDAKGAKKILQAMLDNTDGNGDHYLDDGSTITLGEDKALAVDYSVSGEGGSEPRFLSVPVCL